VCARRLSAEVEFPDLGDGMLSCNVSLMFTPLSRAQFGVAVEQNVPEKKFGYLYGGVDSDLRL
jgi:hypothetical protein